MVEACVSMEDVVVISVRMYGLMVRWGWEKPIRRVRAKAARIERARQLEYVARIRRIGEEDGDDSN